MNVGSSEDLSDHHSQLGPRGKDAGFRNKALRSSEFAIPAQ
jgi:hypothetical protein